MYTAVCATPICKASIDQGCNFFDTAYAYGEGHSEGLLGQTVRANPGKRLYTATKIPPMNREWPAPADSTLKESYPPDHVEEYVHRSLRNADLQSFDRSGLQLFRHGVRVRRRSQRRIAGPNCPRKSG